MGKVLNAKDAYVQMKLEESIYHPEEITEDIIDSTKRDIMECSWSSIGETILDMQLGPPTIRNHGFGPNAPEVHFSATASPEELRTAFQALTVRILDEKLSAIVNFLTRSSMQNRGEVSGLIDIAKRLDGMLSETKGIGVSLGRMINQNEEIIRQNATLIELLFDAEVEGNKLPRREHEPVPPRLDLERYKIDFVRMRKMVKNVGDWAVERFAKKFTYLQDLEVRLLVKSHNVGQLTAQRIVKWAAEEIEMIDRETRMRATK